MDDWKERCEALKKGRCSLVQRLLDEVSEEGQNGSTKEGKLTIVDFSPKARIEKIIKETEPKGNISQAGYDMDLIPWD